MKRIFLLLVIAGLSTTFSPLPVTKNRFVVIAHRGSHIKVPENTIASIEEAIRCGADYTEMDLRTTRDGALVLSHDASVDRMTDGKGLVKELTLEEIKKLKVRCTDGKEYRIPIFKEVLEACKGKINIYLDFKDANVVETYRQIKAAGMERQVVVYINKPEQYGQWRKAAPVMPLMNSLPDAIKTPDQFLAFIEHSPFEVLDNVYDTSLLAIVRQKGVSLWLDVEGPDEGPALWEKIMSPDIQGLQTDHPEALIAYLKRTNHRDGLSSSK